MAGTFHREVPVWWAHAGFTPRVSSCPLRPSDAGCGRAPIQHDFWLGPICPAGLFRNRQQGRDPAKAGERWSGIFGVLP